MPVSPEVWPVLGHICTLVKCMSSGPYICLHYSHGMHFEGVMWSQWKCKHISHKNARGNCLQDYSPWPARRRLPVTVSCDLIVHVLIILLAESCNNVFTYCNTDTHNAISEHPIEHIKIWYTDVKPIITFLHAKCKQYKLYSDHKLWSAPAEDLQLCLRPFME